MDSLSFQSLKTSSQFLAQMDEWPLNRTLSPFPPKQYPISLKSLQKLLTESVYLIYYLSSSQFSCFLSKTVWLTNSNEQHEVKKILVTGEQIQQSSGKERGALECFISKECILIEGEDNEKMMRMMAEGIECCLECYRESGAKGFILPTLINEAIIKTEINQFCYLYYSIIKPKLSQLTPHTLLRALEETRLFRENALLLKYSNHSLLSKITAHHKCSEEVRILAETFQIKRTQLMKEDAHKMIDICESMLQKFIMMLSLGGIITLNVSLCDIAQEGAVQAKMSRISRIISQDSLQNRTIILCFNVEQVPYQFLTVQRLQYLLAHPQNQLPDEPPSPNKRINELELRYTTAINQIELKLFTTQIVRMQELDLASSVLSSLPLPDISYSFEDNPRKVKNNDKCVVLKTKIQLHPRQHPFVSILQGIDLLIINSILIEHDVRTKREASEKRKQQITQMVAYLLERMSSMMEVLWNAK